MRLSVLVGGIACLMLGLPSSIAFAEASDPVPEELTYQLKGKREILLNEKFHKPSVDKAAAPAAAALSAGEGYASVRYSIGTAAQKARLTDLIQGIALALPAKFGNSTGTYIINITLTDSAGKVLAKEPILSFQWTKEKQLFFIEKTVSEVQKTSWRGTLIDRMLVNPVNQRLKISIDASLQQDRSLDFDLIKKAAKAYGSSALAAYYPLPTVAIPMIDSVSGLLNDMYARSLKKSLVEEDEFSLAPASPAKRADIVFTDDAQRRYAVPVLVIVETQNSIFAPGVKLVDGKFDKSKLSETVFNNTQLQIVENKSVNIVELISSSGDAKFRGTRTMLDALLAGHSYGKDSANTREQDTAVRCGDLYDALNAYLSKYDARAMFWAFLQKYGAQLSQAACLSPGRKSELETVGLGL